MRVIAYQAGRNTESRSPVISLTRFGVSYLRRLGIGRTRPAAACREHVS